MIRVESVMWRLHFHLGLFATIYAFRLEASAALLQSGATSTRTSTWGCTGFNTQSVQESQCQLFKEYPLTKPESVSWAIEHNLDSKHATTHSLFREVASHLRSSTAPNGSRVSCSPFLIKRDGDDDRDVSIVEFGCDDLKTALASDYLDACTGTNRNSSGGIGSVGGNNDERGGWRMEGLGSTYNSNEHSFQSERLHWNSVLGAQNTVVFNSAGAHISSQLAPTSLAALHGLNGAATGVCLNLYVTKSNLLQSAPPHTDKQDVVVIQTQGRKRWRVYSPPDCAVKFNTDPFCRGKGEDELSVPMLCDEGSELLLDVTLLPGDVLFVPARFPHTTDTLNCYNDNENHSSGRSGCEERKSSIHLTLGLDTHVWNMNYMSMRTLALRRFGVHDVLLESNDYITDNMDKCVGKVNQLSYDLREGLFSSLDTACDETDMAENLMAYHDRVNLEYGANTHNTLTLNQCLETCIYFQTIWQKIERTHKGMYVAALKEERMREVEEGGWLKNVGDSMVQKRADRLSIFRVPVFFEQLDKLREEHRVWGDRQRSKVKDSLPILLNGDHVEANILDPSILVGMNGENKDSWSSSKVIKVRHDGLFNLQLFDGTVKNGVDRSDIKGPHGLGIFI